MNKELLKLPILTTIGGIILRIINSITMPIFVKKTTDWTSKVDTQIFYTNLISSLIIIVVIGIIIRKTYDKKTLFKSSTLLVIYSFLIFGLSEVTRYFGVYPITASLILYLPTDIFSIITTVLMEITSTVNIKLIYVFVIIEKFAPYLFLLFVKDSKNSY